MKNKSYFDCFMLIGTALSTKTEPGLLETTQPWVHDVFTTIVNVSLIIEESVVEDKNLDIEVDGLLNQRWVDPRLGANELTRKWAVAGQVWEPKITTFNGEKIFEETVFWRGFGEEGNVLLSKKIKIKIKCTRELQLFPFDTQYCTLKLGSYRFPHDEVSIIWDDQPILILNELRTHEFRLINVSKNIIMDMKTSGNFSVATVQFVLRRNFTHYLFCTGTPCFLIVLLNYISFWMDLDKRWNLNILTFSGNLYFYYSSVCLLNPVSYLKALDIFTGVCTFFSLISLLETFLTDSILNLEQKFYHLGKSTTFNKYSRIFQ
nr:glutamate-gated chloride channel-like [Leptinotarsa decemlineata]